MTAELQAKLAARISREYFLSEDAAKKQAREMVRNCPDLLQKNLEQWAVGEPLTEISIDGYSVPMLLALWHSPDFLGAMEVLAEYLTGDRDKAEHRIWRTRR